MDRICSVMSVGRRSDFNVRVEVPYGVDLQKYKTIGRHVVARKSAASTGGVYNAWTKHLKCT